MKILHVCLSCFYIDSAGYQENLLVKQNVSDGHDVLVIASTEIFTKEGSLTYTEPKKYVGSDGAVVIRIPYVKWLPHGIARKLRIHNGLETLITEFEPDVILFHGTTGNEIVTVSKYVKLHPEVIFYADCHEDFYNSARNIVSKYVLHGLFYRNRLKKALPQIRKIFCVNIEAIDYLRKMHGVTKDKIEFFPLGGFVLTEKEILTNRFAVRSKLGANRESFIFLQSGKMTPAKKLLLSLQSFTRLPGENLRFWIAGLLTDAVRTEIEDMIKSDARICFLGWQSTENLTKIMCAVDVYVQPGTQSASMQNALCCGCPVIIYDYPGHVPYKEAGAIIVDHTEFPTAIANARFWNKDLKRKQALEFASTHLDYGKQANRIMQP